CWLVLYSNRLTMNKLAFYFILFVPIVYTQDKSNLQCPRDCEFPRSDKECQACLNNGYSDIVHGRSDQGDKVFKGLLKPGSWSQWDGKRCWISMNSVV